MIRVLHVVSSLGTGSGVASVLMSYYRAIDKNKVQFDFLAFKKREGTFEKEITSLGGHVYYCSKPSISNKFRKEMNTFFKDKENEYQILHCHPIYSAGIFAPYAKKHGISTIISHSHTTKLSDNKLSALRNATLLSLLGKRATHYMACSEEAKKIFYWKDKEDIFLLKNAVNIDKFKFSLSERERIRNELGIKDNETVIGHIGRFTAQKNHNFLIDVFKEYLNLNPSSKLLLLGDGDLFDKMKQKVEQLEITDKVLFIGRKDNVSPYLCAMDKFILPSIFEGLGIVLVEAQLNGLCCLTSSDVPVEADITGNVIFKELEKGIKYWAQSLAELKVLENRDDFQLLNEDLDISKASKTLEEYYMRIIGRGD